MFKKILIGIVLLFVVILIVASSGDETSPASAPVSTSSSSETPDKPQKPAEPVEPAEPEVNTYKAGMYKIGTDMPAGEYILTANGISYIQVSSDSTGQIDSIVFNDNFSNRSIITVVDGQYLTLKSCIAYAFEDAPRVTPSADGILPEGMYKVGVDLPAGEYKVAADGMGYMEVSGSSSHNIDNILSNDNFEGEKYITVEDGQYLKLSHVTIKVE